MTGGGSPFDMPARRLMNVAYTMQLGDLQQMTAGDSDAFVEVRKHLDEFLAGPFPRRDRTPPVVRGDAAWLEERRAAAMAMGGESW